MYFFKFHQPKHSYGKLGAHELKKMIVIMVDELVLIQ